MKKNSITILCISLLLLSVFAVFSKAVKRGFLKQADFAFTVKIQDKIDKSTRLRMASLVANIFEGSTASASPETSVVFVLGATVFAWFDWRKKRIRWGSIIIPIAFGLLILGEIYGKSVVHHPAPPFFMIKNPTTFFPEHYINDEFSYPSGHAARAVFLSVVVLSVARLYGLKRRRYRIVLTAVAVLYVLTVSVSRVYLGHHWLSDILGGLFLGSGFSMFTLIL